MRIDLQKWHQQLYIRAAQVVEKSTQYLSPNSTLSVLFYSVKNEKHYRHQYNTNVSQCIVTTISKLQEEAIAATARRVNEQMTSSQATPPWHTSSLVKSPTVL